jgi:hypothetical protein
VLTDDEFAEIQRLYDHLAPVVDAHWPNLHRLDEGDRAFVVMWVCDGEIGNGGITGLYQNPSGDVAGLLPESAARLGLPRVAELAHAAITVLGAEFCRDFDERYAEWVRYVERVPEEEILARINAVEQEWYAHDDQIAAALLRYARSRSVAG